MSELSLIISMRFDSPKEYPLEFSDIMKWYIEIIHSTGVHPNEVHRLVTGIISTSNWASKLKNLCLIIAYDTTFFTLWPIYGHSVRTQYERPMGPDNYNRCCCMRDTRAMIIRANRANMKALSTHCVVRYVFQPNYIPTVHLILLYNSSDIFRYPNSYINNIATVQVIVVSETKHFE